MTVYHAGQEYRIVERGDTYDQGKPAHYIRYYSEDPTDEEVLKRERQDLCAILAKHIDTNVHHRVILISVEEQGRLFGLLPQREVSIALPAEQVWALSRDSAKPAGRAL